MLLGLSYEECWSLSPKHLMELCEDKIKQQKSEYNFKLALTWLAGKYNSVGFNSPTKYPKKPLDLSDNNNNNNDNQDLDTMANNLIALKNRNK